MLADSSVDGSIRPIDSPFELSESRLEAVGYIYHGIDPERLGKRAVRAGSNLLHFARCPRLDRAEKDPMIFWFRTIRHATAHLDEHPGAERWHWCKHCQRDITQRLLNE